MLERCQASQERPLGFGFWYYELCVMLSNDCPLLVYVQPWSSQTNLGVSTPVWTIKQDWCDVVRRHGEYPLNEDSILAGVCQRTGVKFVASAKANNFKDYVALVKNDVKRKGDWSSVFSPSTNLLFTFRWSEDDNVGKKYFLTNAFEKAPATRSWKATLPGYDL
jgi:hypothetical protein